MTTFCVNFNLCPWRSLPVVYVTAFSEVSGEFVSTGLRDNYIHPLSSPLSARCFLKSGSSSHKSRTFQCRKSGNKGIMTLRVQTGLEKVPAGCLYFHKLRTKGKNLCTQYRAHQLCFTIVTPLNPLKKINRN